MKLFVRDRGFYKSYISMTLLIAMQNLITFAVNLADNVMIGNYDQNALSGISMVNQVQFLLQTVVLGIGAAITVMGAQYWGQHRAEPVRKVTSAGLSIALVVSLVMTAVCRMFPEWTLSLLTDEAAVIAEGSRYMNIVCVSFVLFALSNTMLFALRSVETTHVGFFASTVALVFNIVLNYGLIFGRLGMPEMGVEGAAIATLVSRVVEFAVVAVYALCIDQKMCWRLRDLFHQDRVIFGDFLRNGMPVILAESVWGIAMAAQTSIIGRLGEDTIAASSIAVTVFQVVSVITYASGNASGIIIGKTVGEGDILRVKAYTRTFQILFVFVGVLTGTALWLCKDWVLSLYASITPGAHDLALQFLTVLAVTVVGTSYQVACLTGIVTAGGDTKFVLINDLIHQFLIAIPGAFLSAFVFGAPLWVTFLCLKSDQILKCFVAVVKINRYKWIRPLTREETLP